MNRTFIPLLHQTEDITTRQMTWTLRTQLDVVYSTM